MGKGSKRGNGEGSKPYKRKDGRWCCRYTIQTAGGAKRRAVYGWTRAEAASKLAKAIAERDGGSPIAFDPEKQTVGEYLDRWLESVKSSISERTYRRYELTVRCHLTPSSGAVVLQKLTPGHVEGLKGALLKSLAPTTLNKSLAILSQALNRAISWELLARNPVSRTSRVKETNGRARSLSEAQAAVLVAYVAGTRREALYHVACKLGLRQGELLALRWSDVDLEAGRLTVERSVDTNVTPARFGPTKTGEGRTIKLRSKVVAALEAHRKLQLEERMAAPQGTWEDNDLIFPKPNGKVSVHSRLSWQLHKDLEAAGIPDAHFHILRHTAGTLMVRSGVPIRVVADVLGHADPAITLRRYAHVLTDMQDAAADKMNEYAF
jgi:integrase